MTDRNGNEHHTGGRHRRSAGWWPIVLIVVGLLFLAGNFGFGLGPVWGFLGNLFELWPIALVAVGVDLITRGKYRLLIISLAVAVGIVIAAYGGLGGRAGETIQVNQPVAGATSARVELNMGVSNLSLTTMASPSQALVGTLGAGRNERLEQSASSRGGTLDIKLRSRTRGWIGWPFGSGATGAWTLQLNELLPTDLVVDGGVGKLDLDLAEATLTRLDLDVGVGSTQLTLPRRPGYTARIDGGVGNLVLNVPQSLPLIIDVDTGIGNVNVDRNFEKNGKIYTSAAALTPRSGLAAPEPVQLTLDVGVGNVTVRTIP